MARKLSARANQILLWTAAAAFQLALFAALILAPQHLYPAMTPADLQGVLDARARIELQQAQAHLANDVRTTILQAIAGILVVAGAAATWRQVYVAREGQITERFSRAVDQIGSLNADVRVGGLYALERIAKNSPGDRNAIQFLLGSFVRGHADWPVGATGGPEHPTADVDERLAWLRVRAPDVQAAMGALGRRPRSMNEPVVYLSRVDLRCLGLRDSRLSGAKLRYTNLARAVLVGVELDKADLTKADLRQSRLQGTNLAGAMLSGTYLRGAILREVDLRKADLRGADLRDTILDGVTLVDAEADESTLWPASLTAEERRRRGVVESQVT